MKTYKIFDPLFNEIVDAWDVKLELEEDLFWCAIWVLLKDKTEEERIEYIQKEIEKENYEIIPALKNFIEKKFKQEVNLK